MSYSRIPKSRLAALNIGSADISSAGLPVSVLNNAGSVTAQDGWYLAYSTGYNSWVPTPAPTYWPTWVDAETPSGTANNTNTVFALAGTPNPTVSLQLFVGGLLMTPGASGDYTTSLNLINFTTNVIPPGPNDTILAYYRK